MMNRLIGAVFLDPAVVLFSAWLAIVVLLVAVLWLLAVVHRFVSKPQRIKCPQCAGTGSIGKPNALAKSRCPYCAGSRVVWR